MLKTEFKSFYKNLFKMASVMSVIAIMLCSPTMNAQKTGDIFNENSLYFRITSDTENTVEVIASPEPNGYIGNVVIPEAVQFKGKSYKVNSMQIEAFFRDLYLLSVDIPGTIEVIPNNAFSGCRSLYSVKLGEGIKEIENEAFSVLYNLTSVDLPTSLVKMGQNVFDGANKLTEIKFPENIEVIGSIGRCPWSGNLPLGEVYIGKVFYKYNEDPENNSPISIDIKEGTTCISDEAFATNEHLDSLRIPQSMKYIGRKAFFVCTNLYSIEFANPNTLEYIGNETFSGTPWYNQQPSGDMYIGNLYFYYKYNASEMMPENTTIKIKDGTKAICPYAFEGQENLVGIEIPNSVTKIWERAFGNCTNLKTITFPDSVKELKEQMFVGCKNLSTIKMSDDIEDIKDFTLRFSGIESFTIPANCRYVHTANFDGCPKLKSFTVPANNPYFTSVDGVLFSKDKKTLIAYPTGKDIDYTIPEGTETIMAYAFIGSHVKSITTPKSLINIGENAFDGVSLVSADLSKSNNLQVIGKSTFEDCRSLKTVILPNSIKRIEDRAFNGCDNLSDITLPENLEYTGGRVLSYTAWLEAQPEGVVYINNIADNYKDNGAKEINFKEGTKSISSYLFRFNDSIKTINIPSSVEKIYDGSFYELKNLDQIIGGENAVLYGNVFVDTKLFSESKNNTGYWNKNYITTFAPLPENPELVIKEGTKSCNLNYHLWDNTEKFEIVTSIEFPESTEVITIDKKWYWTNVNTLKVKSLIPPTVIGLFEIPTLLNTTVYVDKSSVEAYKSTLPWCLFKNIVADPAGVEGVEADQNIRVFANGDNIIVEGASDNSSIKVINLNGQILYNGSETRISVPTSGLYIVNVDGKAFKVML